MAQAQSPFGLRLAKNQGGVIVRNPERLILISGNGSALYPTLGALYLPTSSTTVPSLPAPTVVPISVGSIFQNDPINLGSSSTSGSPTRGSVQPTLGATYNTTSNGAILGTFEGVEYSDSSGKRTVSNKWTNPGTFPGSEVWFWFSATSSSDQVYEIQTNSSVGQDIIGKTYGVIGVGTPNFVTGFSTVALNTFAGSAAGGLIVYALAYDPNLATQNPNNGYAPGFPTGGTNNWGDPFVNVYVKLAQGQFAGTVSAF